MARSHDMTSGSIWRSLLGFSIPIMIGNFYQSLLGLAPMYVTAENAFLTQEMICALYEHGRRHFVREVR